MLRISYKRAETLHQWILCGQLAGPWVEELRTCWEHASVAAPSIRSLVDLSDVTFIDENGERLLFDMQAQGVEFLAAGVETKHLLENLAVRGRRPLRKSLGCAKPHPSGGTSEKSI